MFCRSTVFTLCRQGCCSLRISFPDFGNSYQHCPKPCEPRGQVHSSGSRGVVFSVCGLLVEQWSHSDVLTVNVW